VNTHRINAIGRMASHRSIPSQTEIPERSADALEIRRRGLAPHLLASEVGVQWW
jgi:hypothetical protein